MKDSLNMVNETFSGIPDTGVRVVVLVISIFVIGIMIVLLRFKMKEVESEASEKK